jgi:hypothetical protein
MDLPGLQLAANSFAYKRWRSSRRRFLAHRQVAVYDDLLEAEPQTRARQLLEDHRTRGLLRPASRAWLPPGRSSELLDALPTNQIDLRHVLRESPHCQLLLPLWGALSRGPLRHHHLVRAYFLEPELGSGPDGLVLLHDVPGAFTTYVLLCPGEGSLHLVLSGGGAQASHRTAIPLVSGQVVIVPSDLPQGLAGPAQAAATAPVFLLCLKTLAADL